MLADALAPEGQPRRAVADLRADLARRLLQRRSGDRQWRGRLSAADRVRLPGAARQDRDQAVLAAAESRRAGDRRHAAVPGAAGAATITRHHLPLSRTAIELGSERVTNIVALGVLVELTGVCKRKSIEQVVRARFAARLPRSQHGRAGRRLRARRREGDRGRVLIHFSRRGDHARCCRSLGRATTTRQETIDGTSSDRSAEHAGFHVRTAPSRPCRARSSRRCSSSG